MSTRTTVWLTLTLILVALALSAAAYSRLPDRVASHWNARNEVDGEMPRFLAAVLMPVLAAAMLGLLLALPRIDPMRANFAAFRPSFNVFVVVIVAFLLYVHALTLLWNLGVRQFRMSSAVLPALGILLGCAGFMLRRARRNFLVGIRTPWTLSSDSVWRRTHQLGAILFGISGLLTTVGAFFPGPVAWWFVFVPVLGTSLALVVYSYILWRAEQPAGE